MADNIPHQDFLHVECDCVPDLGPSHCHLCTKLGDGPVIGWPCEYAGAMTKYVASFAISRIHTSAEPDLETYARIHNAGFDEAMAQQHADDPSAADEWLLAHDTAVRADQREQDAHTAEGYLSVADEDEDIAAAIRTAADGSTSLSLVAARDAVAEVLWVILEDDATEGWTWAEDVGPNWKARYLKIADALFASGILIEQGESDARALEAAADEAKRRHGLSLAKVTDDPTELGPDALYLANSELFLRARAAQSREKGHS